MKNKQCYTCGFRLAYKTTICYFNIGVLCTGCSFSFDFRLDDVQSNVCNYYTICCNGNRLIHPSGFYKSNIAEFDRF